MKNKLFLGIDTSNYKTSLALVRSEGIVFDRRILLKVKEGERGLRQQEALFQHVMNLPELFKEAFNSLEELGDYEIVSVSASSRPRNVEGSYMPCFNAGVSAAEILASSLGLKAKLFSHQEGHIEAAKRFTELKEEKKFIAFHFSGGTTEVLLVDDGRIDIIGGTKDISFGQVLDRVGVYLGMDFPAGEELDKLAYSELKEKENQTNKIVLPKIKVDDGYINLSGFETHLKRVIEDKNREDLDKDFIRNLSFSIFNSFSDAISRMMDRAKEKTGVNTFLFSGGVSSSSTLRRLMDCRREDKEERIVFSQPELSSDNAVGIAYLGGE